MQPMVLSLAIAPRDPGDRAKLDLALAVMAEVDASIRLRVGRQSGQVGLEAISEEALDAALGSLQADVPLQIGDFAVLYRETITRRAAIEFSTSDSDARIRIALEVYPSSDPSPRFSFVQGEARLLEPWMRLELVTPEMYEGVIRSDLAARRARVIEKGVADGVLEMRADVPLVNILSYARAFSAQTQGRGIYRLSFATWAPAGPLPPLPGTPVAAPRSA